MKAEKGKKVKVEYEGRFENGEVFDSSKHGDHSHPLEFEIGKGQVIPGFEKEIEGMEEGEEKEFKVKAKDAYGEIREDLKRKIPKDKLPPLPKGQELKVGMVLLLKSPEGLEIPARISKIEDDFVELDINHPLAGKDLIFKVKLLEVH